MGVSEVRGAVLQLPPGTNNMTYCASMAPTAMDRRARWGASFLPVVGGATFTPARAAMRGAPNEVRSRPLGAPNVMDSRLSSSVMRRAAAIVAGCRLVGMSCRWLVLALLWWLCLRRLFVCKRVRVGGGGGEVGSGETSGGG